MEVEAGGCNTITRRDDRSNQKLIILAAVVAVVVVVVVAAGSRGRGMRPFGAGGRVEFFVLRGLSGREGGGRLGEDIVQCKVTLATVRFCAVQHHAYQTYAHSHLRWGGVISRSAGH